jgi:hypothetical protein
MTSTTTSQYEVLGIEYGDNAVTLSTHLATRSQYPILNTQYP